MRVSLFGSFDRWASLRPLADLDGEPPWRQVAAQVVLLEQLLEGVTEENRHEEASFGPAVGKEAL